MQLARSDERPSQQLLHQISLLPTNYGNLYKHQGEWCLSGSDIKGQWVRSRRYIKEAVCSLTVLVVDEQQFYTLKADLVIPAQVYLDHLQQQLNFARQFISPHMPEQSLSIDDLENKEQSFNGHIARKVEDIQSVNETFIMEKEYNPQNYDQEEFLSSISRGEESFVVMPNQRLSKRQELTLPQIQDMSSTEMSFATQEYLKRHKLL